MARTIDEGPFINYGLMNDIERIVDAGVLNETSADPSFDERHLSELYRMVSAMDEIEIYVVIRSAVENHRETVVNTLEYMEGENDGNQ